MKKLLIVVALLVATTPLSAAITQLNVLGFGADQSGVRDSTDAIQKGINAASAFGQSQGSLYFPAGVYKISATLVVTNGCTLYGDSRIGATDFSPVKYLGPMLQYTGSSGPAVLVQQSGGIVYKLVIKGLRIGYSGSASPRPDGLVLRDVSEFTLDDVNINGGFAIGMAINGCTLGMISNCDISANAIAMDFGQSSILGYPQMISVIKLNTFIHSQSAIRGTTSMRSVTFRDCWFEYQPIGWLFHPTNYVGTSTMGLDSLLIDSCIVSTGDTNAYPHTRSIVFNANTSSNAINLKSMQVRNSIFYNPGSSNSIEILMGSNTNGLSLMRGLRLEDCKAYSVTNSLVYSDWQNAEIELVGSCWAWDSFAQGNQLALSSGVGKFFYNTLDFDRRRMTGPPINLPSQAPNTWMEGDWVYNSSTGVKRPQWYDGSVIVQVPSANGEGAVRLPVYQNPGFVSSPSEGMLLEADGTNWDPLSYGYGPYVVIRHGTGYVPVAPFNSLNLTNGLTLGGSIVWPSHASLIPFGTGLRLRDAGNLTDADLSVRDLTVSGVLTAPLLTLTALNTSNLVVSNTVNFLTTNAVPGNTNAAKWLKVQINGVDYAIPASILP